VFQKALRQRNRCTAGVVPTKRRVAPYAYQPFQKVRLFAFPARARASTAITRNVSYRGFFNMTNVRTAAVCTSILKHSYESRPPKMSRQRVQSYSDKSSVLTNHSNGYGYSSLVLLIFGDERKQTYRLGRDRQTDFVDGSAFTTTCHDHEEEKVPIVLSMYSCS
jgi:hypothetical protein